MVGSPRSQVEPKFVNELMRELLGKVLHEHFDQLVRVRLTEHEPVVHPSSSDGGPALLVAAEGQYWDVALEVDFAFAVGDPFRAEAVVVGWCALVAEAEEFGPWLRVTERFDAVVAGEAAADGMALVALDPSFSLLEFDRSRGYVPVDDRVAVAVEVEALLAD